MRRLCAFVVFALTAHSIVASAGSCDESSLQGRYILSCKRKNLNTVPPFNVNDKVFDELTLAENQIARLEGSAFVGVRTRRLDLTGNPLIFIAPDAFRGLGDDLLSLLLSFDPALAEFPAGSFHRIQNLTSIEIMNHGFQSLNATDLSGFSKLESLSLTHGSLGAVNAELFQGQRDTLLTLDLKANQLTGVPTEALSRLRSLKSLNLAQNKISRLGPSEFGDLKIEVLDLSTQSYSMTSIDKDAFRGLERTLKNLSLASLSLNGTHLRALKPLTALVDLDLSRNKITDLGSMFVTLTSLLKLNLQDNLIVDLGAGAFSNGASMLVLNLAFNSISSIDRKSFAGLTSLEDLDLGNLRVQTLDDQTFCAQRSTLKYLKLQNSKLPQFQWSAIKDLTELQDLFLADCNIDNIPDFVFQNMKKLRSIDLKSNCIENLTRNSVVGLEGSLVILNLLANRIKTIDSCVFRDFAKIDLFQLSLQQNPLQCDCGLHWLFLWFINVTKDNSYEKKRISWSCANQSNIYFRDLNASYFDHCDPSALTTPCQETQPPYSVTLPAHTEPGRTEVVKISSFRVVNVTSETLALVWEINDDVTVNSFTLTCHPTSGGDPRVAQLKGKTREHQVNSLTPSMTYEVCLKVGDADVTACLNATTSSAGLSLALIYGVSIGGGLSLLLLLLIIVCCCCCVTTPTSRHKDHVINVDEPKLGNNTKRFQKPQQQQQQQQQQQLQGGSTVELQKSRSIADQLESLTDEERWRLINLLTHSGGSVASLDFHSLPRQRIPHPGYITPSVNATSNTLPFDPRYTPQPEVFSKHDYDYIQDDEFYDEISMDEIV